MGLIKRYNLRDFTISHYEGLLKNAKKKYVLRTFGNFRKNENFMIVRHDIDASAAAALPIAKAENRLGIRAVYFILLHSPWYNLLDEKETSAVKELIRLGHDIQLHFDADYFRIKTEEKLIRYLKLEKNYLEAIFKIKINAFAFHNPTPKVLKFNKSGYAGLINTYSNYFREKVAYASDSNGHWRHRRLEEVLNANQGPIQILTHPVFWQKSADYPKHKIWNSILGKAEETVKDYDVFLKERGRENIGGLSSEFRLFRTIDKENGFNAEKYWIRKESGESLFAIWRIMNLHPSIFPKASKTFRIVKKMIDSLGAGGEYSTAAIAGIISEASSLIIKHRGEK